MRRHPLIAAILLAYIAWGAWQWATNRPAHPPDGVLAPGDPQQINVPNGAQVHIGGWTLTIRAHYRVTARILARERYHFDGLADLVPEDLALGWGLMSDNRVLSTIQITQSNRFYYWSRPDREDISKEAIITHSANTHVIPGDSTIRKQLERLRPGQVVTLSGELVDGIRSDGAWIHTSMVRNDTGAGACEVLFVTEVSP